MICIIDYGLGNVVAIKNALDLINVESFTSSNIEDIQKCSKFILPGVGTINDAMNKLKNNNLDNFLKDKIKDENTKLLGICVGMQVLANKSEEGNSKGLGLIEGEIVKFNYQKNNRIPHLGWNFVYEKKNIKLFDDIDDPKYYFLHSYYIKNTNLNTNVSFSKFGEFKFIAAINYKNIFGVQFHPEKSHNFGLKLFDNFAKL